MDRIFIDQMNNTIRLEGIPSRIVSLVPSQTELLYDFGLENEVVGITKFCIYPEKWFKTKNRVGGTKKLNIKLIRYLKPDLIIGNKEENTKEDIEQLQKIAPVWMSDIYDLKDAYKMIEEIGIITNTKVKASEILQNIRNNFSEIRKLSKPKSVLYLIWKNPFFAAGPNTFIDDILKTCGFDNICTEERYPEWNFNTKEHADFVFLSSEPYPFKAEEIIEIQKLSPKSKIILVDGEMFSWYGSRLLLAPKYFQRLLDELSDQ